MGLVVVYLPNEREKLSSPALWEQVRTWMKAAGLSWEKLRLTPDFFQANKAQRSDLQGMIEMVRLGQIDRVVYADIQAEQLANLDWLAFALTLKRYRIPLESFADGVLELDTHLQALTQGFDQLHKKSRARNVQKSI